MPVVQEVLRLAGGGAVGVVGLDGLADLVGAEGVVDDLRGGTALVPVCLADDLLVAGVVLVVDQIQSVGAGLATATTRRSSLEVACSCDQLVLGALDSSDALCEL